MGFLTLNVANLQTFDRWRQVQLSNSKKLLPIPSGLAHGTMGTTINTRFGLL